jgi:putative transcription factor
MDREIEEGLEIDEDYGRKIREARERAGLKQAELAQKINEKQSLLRKIEHEEILPTDEVRVKIARVLNITL